MTSPATAFGEATSASRRSGRLLRVPLVSIWILLAATFTLPGRIGPESVESIDALALLKVGVRGLVFGALALSFLMLRRNASRAGARPGFALFGAFVLWSWVSCLWSPLPAFSGGQALTLSTLFLLAVTVALAWTSGDDTSVVLRHLCIACLAVCAALLAVHVVNPRLSGLERISGGQGATGLLHPTKVGGTASLGLVLTVACRLNWEWRWTRVLLPPALAVFPIVMLMAASRTALLLAIVLVVLLVCGMGSRRWLGALVLVGSLAGIAYPLADPGLAAARRAVSASKDYALRGEPIERLKQLNGRTALWAALWQSFLEAPFVGRGYFVTSKDAKVDVWSGPENRLAHNLWLQVATSTGVIGLGLFLAGLWRPVAAAARRLSTSDEGRRLRRLAVVLGAWYLGWGTVSESFMGALSPESVLAFSLLGLIAGFRAREAVRR